MSSKKSVAVVGVDMGRIGDDAIIGGLRMMESGALQTLHLLRIIDPKTVLDDGDQRALETEEHALSIAPAMLERRARNIAKDLGIRITNEQVYGHGRLGDPAATLLQMCVDYDADLLIVGTHGRRGLDRWLAGSVAEQVMHGARCPVLVARPKDYEGLAKTAYPDPPYPPGQAPTGQRSREPHVQASTTLDSWSPSDNGPTGFRIV